MEAQALKLRITKGPRAGETLEFGPGCRVRVGRVVRGNNVTVKDAGISSKHLSLDFDPNSGAWVLRDLGSSNGTLLKEGAVSPDKPYFLSDGDVVKIGECTSITVELNSVAVEAKSRRNPRQRGASAKASQGHSAVTVSTVSGMNESKVEGGALKCEVVDLDPEEGSGIAGDSKQEEGPVQVSPRRTRGKRKVAEKKVGFAPVVGRAPEDQCVPEVGEKKAVKVRRGRKPASSMENLDEKTRLDVPENDCAVKETCADVEKGLVEDKENLLLKHLEEHGVESQGTRNGSKKRTRAGLRGRKKLAEKQSMSIPKDTEMLHTVEESLNECREEIEKAEMPILGEEDENVKSDKLNVGGTLSGTEPNLQEGTSDISDDRGGCAEAVTKNVGGASENSRKDGSLPDPTKMTLKEWFDFMEVYLPKQIIDKTEEVVAEMRTRAARVKEYVAEQKINKCKEPVQ